MTTMAASHATGLTTSEKRGQQLCTGRRDEACVIDARIAFHRQVSLALFGRKFGNSVPLEKAATRFQRRNAPAKLHKGDKAK